MKYFIAFILSLAMATSSYGYTITSGTNYTTDGSWSDTKSAVGAAPIGGNVIVPSGTYNWGDDGVPMFISTKLLTLRGAGTNLTTINIQLQNAFGFDTGMIQLFTNATVRDFKVTFANNNNATFVSANGIGWHVTQIMYDGSNNAGQRFISVLESGDVGLIDYCSITANTTGSEELIFLHGPNNAWTQPSSLGTTNTVVVENCVFWNPGYVCDANANANITVRFNVIHDVMKIDGHGKWSNQPTNSCREVEAYHNHWTSIAQGGSWDIVELRGGSGMIFSNIVDDNTFGGRGIIQLKEYGAFMGGGSGGAWTNYQTPTYYPIDNQVGLGQDPKVSGSEPVYLWGNTKAGVPQILSWADIPTNAWYQYAAERGHPGDTNYGVYTMEDIIKADRDYYNQTSTFTGVSGMGVGTKAQMLAITPTKTKVGFWVTDEGNWNNLAQTNTSGQLYTWNGSAWTLKYVPLVYPYGSTTNMYVVPPPPPQIAPVANPDTTNTIANVSVLVYATANDTLNTTNGTIYIVSVSPTNGTATITSSTNILFTPTSGFTGTATIGYTINDGVITTNSTSLVSITVTNLPTPTVGYGGLSVWYEFSGPFTNGGAPILDSTTNHFDAWQPDGWTYTITNGVFGKAMWFDGVANSAIATVQTFSGNVNWSVSFWIKPDQTNTFESLIKEGGGYSSYVANMGVFIQNGVITVGYSTQGAGADISQYPTNWVVTASTIPLVKGTWRMVTVTYDSFFIRLYEDGIQSAFNYAPIPSNLNSSGIWTIGGATGSPIGIHNYQGAMDDYRLYPTYTLSTNEVYSLYSALTNNPIVSTNDLSIPVDPRKNPPRNFRIKF